MLRVLPPDVISCIEDVSSCREDRQWKAAIELLQEIVQDLLTPEVIRWTAAISEGRQSLAMEVSPRIAKKYVEKEEREQEQEQEHVTRTRTKTRARTRTRARTC